MKKRYTLTLDTESDAGLLAKLKEYNEQGIPSTIIIKKALKFFNDNHTAFNHPELCSLIKDVEREFIKTTNNNVQELRKKINPTSNINQSQYSNFNPNLIQI